MERRRTNNSLLRTLLWQHANSKYVSFPSCRRGSSHERMSQRLRRRSLRLLAVRGRLCGEAAEANSVTECL